MGTGGSKDQDLIEEANKAANDLRSAEPDDIAYYLERARKIFEDIRKRIKEVGFGSDRLARVNEAMDNFSQAIERAEITAIDAQKREEENRRSRDAKRQYDRLLEAAKDALYNARDSWKRDLERAELDVRRWSKEEPSPETTNPQFKITAEEIERRLTKARSEEERLKDLLSRSRQWDDTDILRWHKEINDRTAAEVREHREREEVIAAKMSNPLLKEAFRKMTDALYFDVASRGEALLSIEVGEILGGPGPDDSAAAALDRFAAPLGGIASVLDVLERVEKAGFPDGPVKTAIIKLIEGTKEHGAGFGARLRGMFATVVVQGNKAGFDVNRPAVRKFFYDVAFAMTSEIGSDSGTRMTTSKYAGEFSSEKT